MSFKWLQRQLGRALSIAGNKHRYQLIVVKLLCLIFLFDVFLIAGSSIYFMNPIFQCQGSQQIMEESQACSMLDRCRVINDFTIVYKMSLFCDLQYERSIIQSSLSVGSLVGLIVMNFVSDLKGRKFALLLDLFVAVLSVSFTLLGAFVESTLLLTFGSVLSGFSGFSLIIISYIILGDVCEESMRQKSSVYINASLSLGLCLFFVLDKWCNHWKVILVMFMLIPISALFAICYVLMEESPNYTLFEKKDPEACLQSIIRIAKINKKTFLDVSKIKLIMEKLKIKLVTENKQNVSSSVFKSLTKWKYLKVIICMSIVESAGNLCFYGLQYAINDVGYSFGINNLVLGITSIIASLVVARHVVNLERKKTLCIAYFLAPLLTFLFSSQYITSSPFICTIILMLIKLNTSTGYFMIVMIQTQSFPLQIQSIGAGPIEAFSQLGSFIAPLLDVFSINHNLPKISVVGCTMLLFLIPIIFVPQSKIRSNRSQLEGYEKMRQITSDPPHYEWLK